MNVYKNDFNPLSPSNMATVGTDNTTIPAMMLEYAAYTEEKRLRKKKKQKQRSSSKKQHARRSPRKSRQQDVADNDDQGESDNDSNSPNYSSSSASSSSSQQQEYRKWMKKRSKLLEKERAKLIQQWRAEARLEEEQSKRMQESNLWQNRLRRYYDEEYADSAFALNLFKYMAWAEEFIANLPLTVGGIALAFANLGVVWVRNCSTTITTITTFFMTTQVLFLTSLLWLLLFCPLLL